VPGRVKADLQAADSGEQARNLVIATLRSCHVGIVAQGTDGSAEAHGAQRSKWPASPVCQCDGDWQLPDPSGRSA
jgi:hypothetical protein